MSQGEHKLLMREEKNRLDMFNEKGYFITFLY